MDKSIPKNVPLLISFCLLGLVAALLSSCVSPPTGPALEAEIQRISGSWVSQWSDQNDIGHWDAAKVIYFSPDGTGKSETRAFGFMVPGATTTANEVGAGAYRANTTTSFKWKCVAPGVFDIRVTSKALGKYWRQDDHFKYTVGPDGMIHDGTEILRKTGTGYDIKGLAAAERLAGLQANLWLRTSAGSFVANYNATQNTQTAENNDNGAEVFSAVAAGLAQAAPMIQQGIQNQQLARTTANAVAARNAAAAASTMAAANTMAQALASANNNNNANTAGASNPDCLQCLQSRAYLTWQSRCQNNMTAQAACYCAAATLIRCQIDKGGCGSTIQALRTAYQQNMQQASQLGTRCFSN